MEKELSLNESIINIRVELQNTKIKKSGKNKFAGFEYYELADFLPKLNELMLKYGVNDLFTIEEDEAVLILMKSEDRQSYKMPFRIFETPSTSKRNEKTGEVKEIKTMQDIQYLGALNTYYKRYLYLNAFGITDGEVIDSMDNSEVEDKKVSLITEAQKQMINNLFTEEEKQKALAYIKKASIDELTIYEASSLIKTKKKEVK